MMKNVENEEAVSKETLDEPFVTAYNIKVNVKLIID